MVLDEKIRRDLDDINLRDRDAINKEKGVRGESPNRKFASVVNVQPPTRNARDDFPV